MLEIPGIFAKQQRKACFPGTIGKKGSKKAFLTLFKPGFFIFSDRGRGRGEGVILPPFVTSWILKQSQSNLEDI